MPRRRIADIRMPLLDYGPLHEIDHPEGTVSVLSSEHNGTTATIHGRLGRDLVIFDITPSGEGVTLQDGIEIILQDAEGVEWSLAISVNPSSRAYCVDGTEPSRPLVDVFRSEPTVKNLRFMEAGDSNA